MKNPITLSQAIEGWHLDADARRLSPNTIKDYQTTFHKFLNYLGDVTIAEITPNQVREFLAVQNISKKTLLNYHIGLSALWTWATNSEIAEKHIIHRIRRPTPEKRDIIPYSEADIKAMLGSLKTSRSYSRTGKRDTQHTLPHFERHRAILLLLLDTGIRAGELCGLDVHHADLRNRLVNVFGKGSKERSIPFSSNTSQAIWKYITQRTESHIGEPLFTTQQGKRMTEDRLYKIIGNIGRRAGINGSINCHRFRHTFAINFLRNGGDVYSLQRIMGHSTLQMVKRYLAIAQVDVENAHKQASPVANWGL